MCRGGRDQGIGSTFIRELLHKLNPEFWILEVEDIASAANEEEREIRTRRMDFYHKNGVKDTTMYTCQYGVNLKLLYLSEKEITGDIEPGSMKSSMRSINLPLGSAIRTVPSR